MGDDLSKLTIKAADLGPRSRLRNTKTGEAGEWQAYRVGSIIHVPDGWNVTDCIIETMAVDPNCQTAVIAEDTKP